jgi:hypothetical protein
MPKPNDPQPLEGEWGPLARCREHQPGERIAYRLLGEEHRGVILWREPPSPPRGKRRPVRYVVRRDGADRPLPDLVAPGEVLPPAMNS